MGNAESIMNKEMMKARTKRFALDVFRLVESIPPGQTATVIGRQLLRSATSEGANYRAACRSKSPADFISKMGIVEEEADECGYWLELLVETNIVTYTRASPLLKEAEELVAITVASIKTARQGINQKSEKRVR